MVNQSNTASQYEIWREVYGDIVDDKKAKSDAMNIRRAVQYFSRLEENCDALIQEQDEIIRSVMRQPIGGGRTADIDGQHPSASTQPALVSTSDMPYDEFKHTAKVASKSIRKQMPIATNRFIRQASSAQIDAIENLEVDIGVMRQHMTNIEVQILDTVPKTVDDVAAKLLRLSRGPVTVRHTPRPTM